MKRRCAAHSAMHAAVRSSPTCPLNPRSGSLACTAGVRVLRSHSDTFFHLCVPWPLSPAADKLASLPAADPSLMTLQQANGYLVSNALVMNKVELENLFDHYGVAAGKGELIVDMEKFITDLKTDLTGNDPIMHETWPPESQFTAHLALSGESHMDFGEVYKPFPKHWGVPPNAQMKGHDGVELDLPNGYGKGNAPPNWVQENMQKDKNSMTTERGVKPYPFGNYSLGAVGF